MTSFQNRYTLRRVAESNAAACMVCYRPSTAVLVSPGQIDFFYTCDAHLLDKGFATPLVDPKQKAALAKKKEDERLQMEIDKVTNEHKSKVAKKGKDKKKEAEKDSEKDVEKDGNENKDKKDKNVAQKEKPDEATTVKEGERSEEAPQNKVFTLHRSVYDTRLRRIREKEASRRRQRMLANPTTFPKVPSTNPTLPTDRST